jgi:endonuclease III
MLPELEDATANQLAKVLAMLDTHIRRLCERRGIRPVELPTRSSAHNADNVKQTEEAPLPF